MPPEKARIAARIGTKEGLEAGDSYAVYQYDAQSDKLIKKGVVKVRDKKGRVVFRLTPSINPEIDAMLAAEPEIHNLPPKEQIQRVCDIIDRHIHRGYELFERGTDFDAYIESRLALIDIPNKDEDYLRERLYEM